MTETKGRDSWRPLYLPAIAEQLMSKQDCEKLVAIACEQGFRSTEVHGGNSEGVRYESGVRVCDACPLDPNANRATYDFLAAAMTQVNNKQYRFGLVGLEPLQVMRYSIGSFFREHSDLGYQNDQPAGRKISLVVQLSEGDQYEGGELILFGDEVMPRTQGTACVFPSWLPHRVEKLTAGTRYSLVGWATGPPFN